MKYPIQIEKSIYSSKEKYITMERWSTYSLLVRETMENNPKKILEIGPGNGIVSDILKKIGFEVKTLDFDSSLNPDYVMDVSDESLLKLKRENFDLIIASEVFEHIKYEDFLKTAGLIGQITKNLIITLPSERVHSLFFYFSFKIPFFKYFCFPFKIKISKAPNEFNGQHYWEIRKRGFPLRKIRRDIKKSGWNIKKDFYNCHNSYHYFFILQK